ncbi:MAG TPA: hypothetical protein VKG25_22345 [Bryobacteraceae bacterium]|nr:hypothetical protein [Bryobacteraceae bacterium]
MRQRFRGLRQDFADRPNYEHYGDEKVFSFGLPFLFHPGAIFYVFPDQDAGPDVRFGSHDDLPFHWNLRKCAPNG